MQARPISGGGAMIGARSEVIAVTLDLVVDNRQEASPDARSESAAVAEKPIACENAQRTLDNRVVFLAGVRYHAASLQSP